MGTVAAARIAQQLSHLGAYVAVMQDGSIVLRPDANEEINLLGNVNLSGILSTGLELDPATYGAVGGGSVDDTAALQATVNAAISLHLPIRYRPTVYRVTSPITITSADGFFARGTGASSRYDRGTMFLWEGPADVPMFRLQDVNGGYFSDYTVRGQSTFPLAAGHWMENITAGVTTTMQGCVFERVTCDGGAADGTGLYRGWVTRVGTGLTDGNNDFHTFIRCKTVNYGVAGWLFNHAQSKAHMLINCTATPNNTTARALVAAGYDWDFLAGTIIAVSAGGSYQIAGFQGSRGAEAAFIASVTGDNTNIFGANIENSPRLLITDINPSASVGSLVSLQGVRYAPSTSLHADGFFILQNHRGNIDIGALRVESSGGASPQIKQAPTVSTLGSYAVCGIRNSYIESESTVLFGSQNAASRGKIENVQWRNRTANTYGMYDNGDYGAGMLERWGTGSPEGIVVAAIGSVFHRSDGGAGTSLYVKESGTGNTGWVAK